MEVQLNLCFCSFFYFLRSNVQCHKQKWRVLFFIRIKLVAHVLACTRAIARIKWRRLVLIPPKNQKGFLSSSAYKVYLHTQGKKRALN